MARRRTVAAALAVVGFAVFWFLAVDYCCFFEYCEDCGNDRFILQYRFFGLPITQNINEQKTLIEVVARDLGVPCQHEHAARALKQKWWGLIWRSRDYLSTVGVSSGHPWYNEEARSRLRDRVAANPQLPREFHDHVLVDRDMVFLRNLTESLRPPGEGPKISSSRPGAHEGG